MPQPYDGPVQWGAESILERPTLATKVASVSAAWSMVEHDLVFFYAFLMSKWTNLVPAEGFVPTHPVALLNFTTLHTLNSKLDLFRALGDWALTPEEAVQLRDVLIPLIRNRARERNTVAHGVWGVHEDLPDRLVLIKMFGSHFTYNEADFDAMRGRFLALLEDIRVFEQAVQARVQQQGWTLAPEEPPLDQMPGEGQE